MSRKTILFIDTESSYVNFFRQKCKELSIDHKYDIQIKDPYLSDLKGEDVVNKIVEEINEELDPKKTEIIFVDIKIDELSVRDTSGIDIAEKLKKLFPDVLVFMITNYYTGEDIDLFTEATFGLNDGVINKEYLINDNFDINRFQKILDAKKTNAVYKSNKHLKRDRLNDKKKVVVITALKKEEFKFFEIEFNDIRKYSEINREKYDATRYYYMNYMDVDLIAATDNKMGLTATSSLCTRVIERFDPNIVVMVGICGGIKNVTCIGDVIIPKNIHDYASGKLTIDKKTSEEYLKNYHEQVSLDIEIEGWIRDFISDDECERYLNEIQNQIDPIPDNNKKIKVHLERFASTPYVVASDDQIEKLIKVNPKVHGFDMESFALYYACSRYSKNRAPLAISIKGVSDFGDKNKNENETMKSINQKFAAQSSIKFFRKLLDDVLIPFIKD